MTPELKQILDGIQAEFANWNSGVVSNEQMFLDNIQKLNEKLTEYFKDRKIPKVEEQ